MVNLIKLETAYINPEQIVSIYSHPVTGVTTVLMTQGQQITVYDASPAQVAERIKGKA